MTIRGQCSLLVVDARNALYRHVHRALADGYNGSTAAEITEGELLKHLALSSLLSLVEELAQTAQERQAANILLVEDTGTPPWRFRLCPEYKQHRLKKERKEGSEERKQHARTIVNGLMAKGSWALFWGLLGICTVRAAGEACEADDIIARIVRDLAPQTGYDLSFIHSSDHDLFQLLSPSVIQLCPRAASVGQSEWTAARLTREFGVAPKDWTFWKALVGDKSDGIPGVGGLGEVRARLLFSCFGSSEAIWEALQDGSFESKILAHEVVRGPTLPLWAKRLQQEAIQGTVLQTQAVVTLVPPEQERLLFSQIATLEECTLSQSLEAHDRVDRALGVLAEKLLGVRDVSRRRCSSVGNAFIARQILRQTDEGRPYSKTITIPLVAMQERRVQRGASLFTTNEGKESTGE
jgi:5'-3' exonuclease